MSGLILDTHIWFWLNSEAERFSPSARDIIERNQRENGLYIPAICFWEIALMSKKSRLVLGSPVEEWIKQALTAPGLNILPLSPEIAIESVNLPGNFHADPADRLIVATARVEDLTLVTCDRKILDYAEQGYVGAISI